MLIFVKKVKTEILSSESVRAEADGGVALGRAGWSDGSVLRSPDTATAALHLALDCSLLW